VARHTAGLYDKAVISEAGTASFGPKGFLFDLGPHIFLHQGSTIRSCSQSVSVGVQAVQVQLDN
jgi:hypothetical protein